MNGHGSPHHQAATEANIESGVLKSGETAKVDTILPGGGGGKAKIVIEDPAKPDVICTVQTLPPSGRGAGGQRAPAGVHDTEQEQEGAEGKDLRKDTSPGALPAGSAGPAGATHTQQQGQTPTQPNIDPKVDLQLAMLDNQLRNILKPGREVESQASSSGSDRAKCRDTAPAQDLPPGHTLSPPGAFQGPTGHRLLPSTPMLNGTLDAAMLANLIEDDAEVQLGGSAATQDRDNRNANIALHNGAINNTLTLTRDQQQDGHGVSAGTVPAPSEQTGRPAGTGAAAGDPEYQAEKEVSVQKPEQLIRIDDDSPRKLGDQTGPQISMPGLGIEHEDPQEGAEGSEDYRKVVLEGAMDFLPRHNSILFGGVEEMERSHTYLPGKIN